MPSRMVGVAAARAGGPAVPREDDRTDGGASMSRRLGVGAALVDGVLVPGDVALDGDRVEAVGLPAAAGGRIAAPGLVDLQVNGFDGVDVMTADADGLAHVGRALAARGVTSWLPTLVTASRASTDAALDVLATACRPDATPDGARPLGVHLEGP